MPAEQIRRELIAFTVGHYLSGRMFQLEHHDYFVERGLLDLAGIRNIEMSDTKPASQVR